MKYDIGIGNAIIVSGHNNYAPTVGSIGIAGERIVCITTGSIEEDICVTWIDGAGKILMPGLVNGHCHGDMTLARGLGDDLTLLEQNKKFANTNWFYTLLDDEDRYYSRQLTYCEALLSGTTFIAENMYWGLGDASQKAMKEVGIRGALVEDVRVDFIKPDELISDQFLESHISSCKKEDIIPVIGSISEEDYEETRLQRIKEKISSYQVLQTCHLAENTWRLDIIKEKYGTTPIDYLFQNKYLDENLLSSHVVYATDDDIKKLADTNTKVISTPLCEMKIEDGIAPIPQMVRQGITVCLGTDGAMWNNSNDIFREMKAMSLLHTINSGIRSLSKSDILDMATINGAKVFGIDADYGTIEEGKKADLILIETRTPHMCPIRFGVSENVTSNIVYSATGQDVTDVVVNGKHLVKNSVLQNIDLTYIMNKVQIASEKIERHNETQSCIV